MVSSARIRLDQFQAADVGQLDVRNHQVRSEIARGVQRQPAVRDRLRLMAMRCEQIAEQLDVEGVVLDNQDLGQTNSTLAFSQMT